MTKVSENTSIEHLNSFLKKEEVDGGWYDTTTVDGLRVEVQRDRTRIPSSNTNPNLKHTSHAAEVVVCCMVPAKSGNMLPFWRRPNGAVQASGGRPFAERHRSQR
jgi:hypothetical protein